LGRIKLVLEEISNDLLAPGNIFWKKSSGLEIKISAKEDIINFAVLNKLALSKQVLLIEDSEQFKIQNKFQEVFSQYKAEIQLKEKIKWRREFNFLLNEYFYKTSRSQFELDQICWKMFSQIDMVAAREFIDRDKDFFMRTLSIASSYVLCAYLVGYYDEKFLTILYNSAVKNLMDLGKDQLIMTLKVKLEELRKKLTITNEDKEYVKSLIDFSNFDQALLFEKIDGSGLMSINMFEMSDLELILCSLNDFFSFNEQRGENILAEISKGNIKIDQRMIDLIKKNFEMFNDDKIVA